MTELKLKLKSNVSDIIDATLMNNGITAIEEYKHIEDCNFPTLNPKSLHNIEEAVSRVAHGIKNNERIGILVDSDTDGFCSAVMMYNILKNYDVSVTFVVSDKKRHGLNGMVNQVLDDGIKLLIAPDSSSNDVVEHKQLKAKGVSTVVLDHHLFDEKETPAIVVNNQSSKNTDTNVNYTGVGMVYLFGQLFDKEVHQNELALFTVGQIADISDVSDLEIRSLLYKGYKQLSNHKLFSRMLTGNINPHSIGFELAPVFNAVCRIGTVEDKLDLLNALAELHDNEKVNVKRRKKIDGKIKVVDVLSSKYEKTITNLNRIKNKQTTQVKKAMDSVVFLGDDNDCNMKIIEIRDTKIPSAITGLIANKYSHSLNMPVVVGKKSDNDYFQGSMRSPEHIKMSDWLNNSFLATSQGHQFASGVKINKVDIDELLTLSAGLDVSKTDEIEVDGLYYHGLSVGTLKNISRNGKLFGGKVNEPVLGVKGINLTQSYTSTRGDSVLHINHNGVIYVMFNAQNIIKQLQTSQMTYADIVGTVSDNNWKGKVNQQVMIKNISLYNKEHKKVETPEDSMYF